MKNLFLPVAMLATLASCSSNEIVDDAIANKNQIEFSTLNDKVSRVANDASSDYAVYAQYTKATAGWYMENVKVTSADIVDGTYYWPSTALDFYAYAPQVSTAVELTAVDPTASALGTLSITYTVPTAANEDFTVATPVEEQLVGTSSGAVDFSFKHMLAKIKITAITAVSGGSLSFTNAVFTVVENKGTVDVTSALPVLTKAPALGSPVYTIAKADIENPLYIMPQTMTTACSVELIGAVITIAGKSVPVTVKHDFDASQVFAAGKQYNLNFTVSLTEIKFTSTSAGWGTATEVPVQ